MTRYSVQPRDRIFVKGYGFLSFAKNIGKSISKKLSCKSRQNFLIMVKNLQRCVKTAAKWAIQKIAEATDDMISNKVANRITKVSRN